MIGNNDICKNRSDYVIENINIEELVADMCIYRDFVKTLIKSTDCSRARTILQAKYADMNNILTPLFIMLQIPDDVDCISGACITALRDRFLDLVNYERNVGRHESYVKECYKELGLSYDMNS